VVSQIVGESAQQEHKGNQPSESIVRGRHSEGERIVGNQHGESTRAACTLRASWAAITWIKRTPITTRASQVAITMRAAHVRGQLNA
jgi:hypothetical protein